MRGFLPLVPQLYCCSDLKIHWTKLGNNGQNPATMGKMTVKQQIIPLLSFYYCSLLALNFMQACKGDGEEAKFKEGIFSNLVACKGGKAGQKDRVCSWCLDLW